MLWLPPAWVVPEINMSNMKQNTIIIHLPVLEQSTLISISTCLYVYLHAYLRNHISKLYAKFSGSVHATYDRRRGTVFLNQQTSFILSSYTTRPLEAGAMFSLRKLSDARTVANDLVLL